MESVNEKGEGTITDKTGSVNEGQRETGERAAPEKLPGKTSLKNSENDGQDADTDLVGLDSRLGSPKNVIAKGSATETMEVEVEESATETCPNNEGIDDHGKGAEEGDSCRSEASEVRITIASEDTLGKHSEEEDKNAMEIIHPRKRKEQHVPTGIKRTKMESGLASDEAVSVSKSSKHPTPPIPPPPPPPLPSQTGPISSKRPPVKPVQNWKKVIRLPTSLEHRLASDQIFRTILPTYFPCVPKGTSQRLVEYLTPTDLEQLCCPGCKDRFLLPSSFFQHVYRKSVKLTFTCSACEGKTLTFFNRCHLRTHVVGHMERDGVSAVAADRFDAAPLEVEELDIGFVDDTLTSELNLAHSEVVKSDPSLTQCHECRLSVAANDSHYLGSSEDASAAVECQHCNMMLPNQCSLAAHGRIHEKSTPFICPECSKAFQTWSVFHNHVQTSCLHEARVLSLTCRLCLRQDPSDEPAAAVLHQDFLGHMFRSHTKLFYKCTGCAKAFDSKTAIYAHRDEYHGDASADRSARIEADFTLLYKAPWLPSDKGGNIFPSRLAYEKRLGVVSRKWKRRFGFRCLSCRTVFAAREELESHNTMWCHMQNNNGAYIPRLNGKSATILFPSESESKWVDKEKELEGKLEEIRKLCPLKCSHCDEMLSLLRAHFASHGTDEGATGEPETVARSEESKQEPATPVDPPPRKVLRRSRPDKSATPSECKSVSSDDVVPSLRPPSAAAEMRRTTRSAAEAITAAPKVGPADHRKKTKQLGMKKEASDRKQSSDPVKPEPISPSSTPPLTISDSPPVKKKAVSKSKGPVPFVESLGKDVPSQRNLLKINRLDNKALAVGCSVNTSRAEADRDYGNRSGAFSCNLCKFVTDTQISFEAHILIHKNQRYGNAFQCKECGVSFSSEASWRTHLLLLHRIKAPKAADYCSDLRVPLSPGTISPPKRIKSKEPAIHSKERPKSGTNLVPARRPDNADNADKADAATADDDAEEDGKLVIDEGESKPFRSRQNVCSVCRSAFSSPLELQRHFRGHGMAFLKGKNPLMVAKNPLLPGLKQPRDK